jgi:hypothetical protein
LGVVPNTKIHLVLSYPSQRKQTSKSFSASDFFFGLLCIILFLLVGFFYISYRLVELILDKKASATRNFALVGIYIACSLTVIRMTEPKQSTALRNLTISTAEGIHLTLLNII